MTLIEGFGDEVTLLLTTTVVVIVLYLVWMSTYVPDRPLLYLQLSTGAGSPPFNGADIQGLNRFSSMPPETEGAPPPTTNENLPPPAPASNVGPDGDTGDDEQGVESRDASPSGASNTRAVFNAAISSMRSLASQVPQTISSLRQRRSRRANEPSRTTTNSQTPSASSNSTEASADSQNSSQDSNANQFSVSTICLELPENLLDQRASCYFIKLKFLNDLQAEVEVSPSEKLSEFKSRVFKNVLSNGGQVRLIFAGGLLRDETQRLADCGIYSNCVMHCQVLTQTGNLSSTSGNSNTSFGTDSFNTENIDLSNLLALLFAVFLLVLWYLRFSYRHLFTPPTTFTLIAITLLFLLAVYASFIL